MVFRSPRRLFYQSTAARRSARSKFERAAAVPPTHPQHPHTGTRTASWHIRALIIRAPSCVSTHPHTVTYVLGIHIHVDISMYSPLVISRDRPTAPSGRAARKRSEMKFSMFDFSYVCTDFVSILGRAMNVNANGALPRSCHVSAIICYYDACELSFTIYPLT